MKRLLLALVLLTGSMCFAVVSPSVADDYVAHQCTTGDYVGKNRLWYYSYSSTSWKLERAAYNFGPSNSGSDKNNQDILFYGGSQYWSAESYDNLLRDATWHTGIEILSTGHDIYGQKGNSSVLFTDTFDTSGADPHCDAETGNF